MKQMHSVRIGTLAFAGWLGLSSLSGQAAVDEADRRPGTGDGKAKQEERVVVRILSDEDAPSGKEERAWLGVAVEEATEALSEQLDLEAGVGLVVAYVTPDSPAAKAGLKKNDVLVELAGHALSHPAQFRRLVQARQGGDTVKLVFYRSGKQQTATATLEKAPAQYGLLGDTTGIRDSLRGLQREFREQHLGEAIREYSKSLQESLGQLSTEYGPKFQIEIERNIEMARKAIQEATHQISKARPRVQDEIERSVVLAGVFLEEATRQMSNSQHSVHSSQGHLKDLLHSGISVDKNATVVLRSSGKATKTIVKSDDWGTLTLVGSPNQRLTAHDKDGKLLFDGEIETDEQRAKVPPDVWERVAPLLDELSAPPAAPEPPKPPKAPKPPETSSSGGAGYVIPSMLLL